MNIDAQALDWLREACVMERALESILRAQLDQHTKPSPASELLRANILQAQRHAEAMEACLLDLLTGSFTMKTPSIKTMRRMNRARHPGGYGTGELRSKCSPNDIAILCRNARCDAAHELSKEIAKDCETVIIEEAGESDELEVGPFTAERIPGKTAKGLPFVTQSPRLATFVPLAQTRR